MIGVNVPNFGSGTDPASLRGWARTVEGLGFDLLMLSDHVVVTPDVAEQYPAPFYEPFTTLSWLAGITDHVMLGTTVLIAPYRHPLLVARMAANLNDLSGGRLVLGVGAGWARQEFAALGVPFERRGALTGELITTLREAWRDNGYRAGTIPIWLGGNSDAALRRAVRLADAWHPLRQTAQQWRDSLARLRELGDGLPKLAPRIFLRLTDDPPPQRRLGEGTVEQVVGDIEQLRADGAHAVVLDPDETLSPRTAWHALATVRKELS
nr:LLM class flavin-dependent oxidoreductase [Kibdelosporangium phytohabitans]